MPATVDKERGKRECRLPDYNSPAHLRLNPGHVHLHATDLRAIRFPGAILLCHESPSETKWFGRQPSYSLHVDEFWMRALVSRSATPITRPTHSKLTVGLPELTRRVGCAAILHVPSARLAPAPSSAASGGWHPS